MNAKRWAVFFICMLSADYMRAVVNAANWNGKCCRRRITRQTGCRLKPQLIKMLDDCLERIRDKIPDSFLLEDSTMEEYELMEGEASGFKNFKRKSYRCICGSNLVRIFIEVSFLRILVTYVITLLDDLLGGLLGGLGSALSQLLGNVVNLLIRVLALDIVVEIVILQRFIPGSTCVVESYKVSKLTNIKLLNLNLSFLAETLSPLLAPILDLVLQLIFTGRVKEIFVAEFQALIIQKNMVTCF